jgi:hypothetical protein
MRSFWIATVVLVTSCTTAESTDTSTKQLPAAVRASLAASGQLLMGCGQKAPDAARGTDASFTFTILPTGMIGNVQVGGANLSSPFKDCVKAVIESLPTSKAHANLTATVSLKVTPGPGGRGLVIAPSVKAAPDEFVAACHELGIAHVCNQLGTWYSIDFLADPAGQKGRREFLKACDLGLTPSCTNAAETFFKVDDERAAALIWKSCEGGKVSDCELGFHITNQGPAFGAMAKALPDWASKFAQKGCALGGQILCNK